LISTSAAHQAASLVCISIFSPHLFPVKNPLRIIVCHCLTTCDVYAKPHSDKSYIKGKLTQ